MTPSVNNAVFDRAETYLPPWRERRQDGTLGDAYGPPSAAAYAVQTGKARDWSWRPAAPLTTRSRAVLEFAAQMAEFMRPTGGELRLDVPDRERTVYVLVFERGHAVRWVARHLGMRASTVRVYIRRLRERLGR